MPKPNRNTPPPARVAKAPEPVAAPVVEVAETQPTTESISSEATPTEAPLPPIEKAPGVIAPVEQKDIPTPICERCEEETAIAGVAGTKLCAKCLEIETAAADDVAEPRNFGKVLTLPHIQAFFQKHADEANKVLRTGPGGSGWQHNESKREAAEDLAFVLNKIVELSQ